MPIQSAYAEVERLINKFKRLSTAARKAYNEDNTRKDFIMPLFRALEWDTQNSVEVSAEERVSRGWVDFSFRIGGVPRFYLETKRISEDLTKPEWVRQAMDYAWTKGVTWALLSDFEGLRVFNAEWKEDNPAAGAVHRLQRGHLPGRLRAAVVALAARDRRGHARPGGREGGQEGPPPAGEPTSFR